MSRRNFSRSAHTAFGRSEWTGMNTDRHSRSSIIQSCWRDTRHSFLHQKLAARLSITIRVTSVVIAEFSICHVRYSRGMQIYSSRPELGKEASAAEPVVG